MDMDGYGWIIAWISTQAPISSSTPCFGLLCTTWRWARHSLTKGHDGALGLGWYLDESSGRFRIFVQQQGLAMVTKGPSSLLGNVNFWYDDDISCGKVSDNTHTHSLPSWVLRHLHHTIYHGCNTGKLRRIKVRRPVLFTSTWVFNGIWIWNFQQFQHLPKNRSGFHVVKITSPWVVPWVDIFWHILTAMPWEDPHWIVLGGQIWHLFGSEPQPRWGE